MILEDRIPESAAMRCFDVHGCRVRLRTDCPHFAAYAAAFLQGFECASFAGPAEVESVYLAQPWDGVHASLNPGQRALISDNAWLLEGRLVAIRRGTLYLASMADDRIQVQGFFPYPRILRWTARVPRRWSRRVGMWESETREEYHLQTVRDLLHFPLFAALRKRGFTILHGSCVESGGRAVSLFGYNRVGKSSLALALMIHHGWAPLADNFILTDGERVYPFPERLRYSEATLDLVGGTGLSTAGKRRCWGKLHFDLEELGLRPAAVAEPALSAYVLRGNGAPGTRALDPAGAVARMGAMNAYLHEFDNYSFLNLLPGFFSFEDPDILHRFFQRGRCLELTAGSSVRETAETLAGLAGAGKGS